MADQQNRLAVNMAVRTEGRIKTFPFTIETKPVFDGKSLLGRADFMRLCEHHWISWPLTVKAAMNWSKTSMLTDTEAQFEA